MPSTLTQLGEGAFFGCSSLKSIDLNRVTELGVSAFQETGLKSVVIPDSVVKAGYFTFYGCSSLESVTFGKGLSSTSYMMFENCYSLKSISFGGLTELDARTFAGCTALESITLPKTITKVGNGTFGNCSSLRSFTSTALTCIPYQTFVNDTALTAVNLNEGLTAIYRIAFGNCPALTSVVLPSTVTYVASRAFDDGCRLVQKQNKLEGFGRNGLRSLEHVTVRCERNYDMAYQVLSLVNAQRAASGAGSLVMNAALLETAMQRGAEIAVLFSHTRPDGSSCFDLNTLMSGENIAYGQTSASAVMNSWMNSSGHKANILDTSYTTIGIGCVKVNGTYYWVQCFGTGDEVADCAMPSNRSSTQKVSLAAESFSEAPADAGIRFGVSDEDYTYKLRIQAADIMKKGSTCTAQVFLTEGVSGSSFLLQSSDIIWKSSSPSVVSVSGGKLTASESGVAMIEASTPNGHYKATHVITVPQDEKAAVSKNNRGKNSGSKNSGSKNSGNKNSSSKNSGTEGSGKKSSAASAAYGKLQLNASKTGKNNITISWKKATGAAYYAVYGGRYGNRCKYLCSTDKKTYKDKKLKKATYYQYYVKAYNRKGKLLATSKTIYAATSGGKYTNVSSVRTNKKKAVVKRGKTYRIKTSSRKASSGKLRTYRKIAYESSNTGVATVSSKGVVKAKKKGSCWIYCYAQNGKCAKVKITVK